MDKWFIDAFAACADLDTRPIPDLYPDGKGAKKELDCPVTFHSKELEALGTADIIRRAGLDLQIVSITGERTVTGSHGIRIVADEVLSEADFLQQSNLHLHHIHHAEPLQ